MQDELHDTHNDDDMPYEIVDIQPCKNLPHYPIDNKMFEVHETEVNWKKGQRKRTVDPLVDPFYHILQQLLT